MSPREHQREASSPAKSRVQQTSKDGSAGDTQGMEWNAAALPQPSESSAGDATSAAEKQPEQSTQRATTSKLDDSDSSTPRRVGIHEETLQLDQLSIRDAEKEHRSPAPAATGLAPVDDAKKGTSPATSQEEWDEKQDHNLEASAQGEGFLSEDDGERTEVNEKRESRPEIQGIMDQFEQAGAPEPDALKQTPTGGSVSSLPVFQYPPRSSSLTGGPDAAEGATQSSPKGIKSPQLGSISAVSPAGQGESNRGSIYGTQATVVQPPLPAPDPEPDLPFDFHRFLEQLRHRTADPVAKFLRSFLQEFAKKPWMVHEQQKIISDFLTFIANRMAQCEVWKNVSDAEFDNAREGMEKLVMNRLYTQTFSPEIPPPDPSRTPNRHRPQDPNYTAPGRRGQHQEDTERDEVLAQKIRIYGWVKEQHLDLPPFSDKGRKFLVLAQQELTKINSYRAPRDKVICVLNSCKVLFGFLRNSSNDTSADSFIPLLIYTVLKASPSNLVSNLQYIVRFRNPDKLNGEAGYYMSSLMGAVQFIENLDRTSLTISDADFEQQVEKSVSAIAEKHQQEERRKSADRLRVAEKSRPARPEVSARNSQERQSQAEGEENAAVAGLLRSIQKPLSTIGRFLTEESSPPSSSHGDRAGPALTPQPGATPRQSPMPAPRTGLMGAVAGSGVVSAASQAAPGAEQQQRRQQQQQQLAAHEAAARQASAEAAEAHRRQRAEHQTVVETLAGMFPGLDRDLISDVVRQKEGRVGLAVDACLALSR